jgi:fucose 4-O-acetylase-like acetyltransferase
MIYIVSLSFSRIDLVSATIRLLKALYANGHYIDWVQLWFLPHLFLINIFAFFFYWLVKRSPIFWLKWILLIAVQVVGVLMIDKFWPFDIAIGGRHFSLFGLPLSLDLVLVSGFFFILGSEVNHSDLTKFFAHPLASLLSGLGLLAMVIYLPDIIDFNTRLFASLPVNSLEAVLGIIFILSISYQIEKVAWLSAILRYIGQASLIILIFHVPVQESWGAKMMAITNNQVLSYWIAYPAGVLGPIFIYQFIIQPNPVLRSWFGLPAPRVDQPPVPLAQTDLASG